MSSASYHRLMKDAAFHAGHSARSFRSAKLKAPLTAGEDLERAIEAADKLVAWAERQALAGRDDRSRPMANANLRGR